MRVYHQLVFNQFIEGTTALYTNPALNAQLALTEHVELFAIADTVSGTSPTLTVALEESPDGIIFTNRNSVPEINATSLSTSANTTAVGRDPGVKLGSGFARLRVQIGGSSQKAHVRVWATGIRDDRDTPLTILGQSVLQWVRSDLGITLNGTTVSTWADQSGKGNDFTQGTSANQPLYATGGPGNKPFVQFDGINDNLSSNLSLPAPGTTPSWRWIVFQQVSWTLGNGIWNDWSPTAAGIITQNATTPNLRVNNGVNGPENSGGTIGLWTRGEIYLSNSTSDYIKLRSTSQSGTNCGNNGPFSASFLGSGSGAGFANVLIAEAFIINRLPSVTERAALDAYCTARYGTGLV